MWAGLSGFLSSRNGFVGAMVPLVELRGAIPIAVGMELGLSEWLILLVALIGNA